MSATIEYRRPKYRSGASRTHAVPAGEPAAVCGLEPEGGWAPPGSDGYGDRATCPACRRKLGMGPLIPPRAEGGAR